ncbi:hypothetical protein ABZ725_14210 [Streptomyces sp. NPDC006872]|uniref:hypothetical protein n=1 Tax=Streptomyces sp. NPDC006872 TaxID=3155720 RepID=UPI00340B6326
MTTYTSETVTRTIRRWIIPAAQPWGACIGDINAATVAACRAYRETCGLPEDAALPDNALRFHVADDAIVISFETDTPVGQP